MYFGLLLVVAGVAAAICGSDFPFLAEIVPASRVTVVGLRMTREVLIGGSLVVLGLVACAMSARSGGRLRVQCASCGWHGPLVKFHANGKCPRCGNSRYNGREIGRMSSSY